VAPLWYDRWRTRRRLRQGILEIRILGDEATLRPFVRGAVVDLPYGPGRISKVTLYGDNFRDLLIEKPTKDAS
jgi:hypothetical protein